MGILSLLVCPAAVAAAAASGSGSDAGYSALCAVGRNENRYVREWVDYHKCLGFSRIYLYDHGSSVPMSSELGPHLDSGFLHYVNFSAAHRKFQEGYTSDLERFMSTVQGQAYKHCMEQWGSRHTFIGFIDLDEFLVLYDPGLSSVNDLLRDYEQFPGLSIYWVLLGSSGHVARPKAPVVESYTACTPHDHKFNTQFKTFVNTRFKPTMYSPHRAVFNATSPDNLEPYMVNEHRQRIARGRNKNSTHERGAVFHYVTKSFEDFSEKMNRGGGAGVTRPKYYFTLMDRYSKATCDGALATRSRFCGVPVPAEVQAKLDDAAAKGKTGRGRAVAKKKANPALS
ncbi:hypothetical protein CHLRE_10g446150v5 [Chlamydomonas reinhardtii]|uniref:Glycosyltransferase family 92 protein n=1 Tax=Chlamydomonas reinhardtii TaxID=3055 RepID=A0A2K3DAW1_CHLRE|nr:uncharacterized protein CHLRE_10g446150v5 [Chlamydomonas reinhardtii]PNW77661.1 hypothetical protein CHLRE_10g446150v5 [Chlamydomonas reinhardtii]